MNRIQMSAPLSNDQVSLPPHALEQLVGVEGGQTGPLGRAVHPGHVVHRPEEPDLIIDAAVGLHAFEQLLGIVKHLKRKS